MSGRCKNRREAASYYLGNLIGLALVLYFASIAIYSLGYDEGLARNEIWINVAAILCSLSFAVPIILHLFAMFVIEKNQDCFYTLSIFLRLKEYCYEDLVAPQRSLAGTSLYWIRTAEGTRLLYFPRADKKKWGRSNAKSVGRGGSK